MPIKIIDHGSAQYQQMIDLRMEILRKPLGLHFEADDLEKEKEDILIGAFEDDDMVACCVLTKLSPELCKLRQMAVHQRMQRNGVGHAIMQFAENVAPWG
ncbi:MAG: GNAT family N-acetyltransferase [Chitinophagaceae bacterium]|nr:GNAT family N-acetyltransferase [Chitinophagaceae bacterium]